MTRQLTEIAIRNLPHPESGTTKHRHPVHLYIDEVADYANDQLITILSQVRKYNVGVTIAHQYLHQLSPSVRQAVNVNTAIKLAAGLPADEARSLAPQMRVSPEVITQQPKLHFAAFVKGVTQEAIPLAIPAGKLEARAGGDVELIRHMNRARYTVSADAKPQQADSAPEPPPDPDDVAESGEW